MDKQEVRKIEVLDEVNKTIIHICKGIQKDGRYSSEPQMVMALAALVEARANLRKDYSLNEFDYKRF